MQSKSHPSLVGPAVLAKQWFWPSYLLANVLGEIGKATKRDQLHHPEVKLLNTGVVASLALLALASAFHGAGAEAGTLGGALAAGLGAGGGVPLSLTILVAAPVLRVLWRHGGGLGHALERGLDLGFGDKRNKAASKRDTAAGQREELPARGAVSSLAALYGVLAVEAFVTALAKPATLPYCRAAAFYVLHLNARDMNPAVIGAWRFKYLNDGILYSSIAFFGTAVVTAAATSDPAAAAAVAGAAAGAAAESAAAAVAADAVPSVPLLVERLKSLAEKAVPVGSMIAAVSGQRMHDDRYKEIEEKEKQTAAAKEASAA